MAKSFKDRMTEKAVNPTMQFISTPSEDTSAPELEEPQTVSKTTSATTSTKKAAHPSRRALPQYDEETKSRRLQLLLTPSLYEAVKERAAEERISVNEYINSVLKTATTKRK